MSVQRYNTDDGTRWRVRWRDGRGQMHSRSFASKRDAAAYDTDIKSRKWRGELIPRAGKWTLAKAWEEWLATRGAARAPSTRAVYESVWTAHISRHDFDKHRLTELVAEPKRIEDHLAALERQEVGPAARRKVVMVLSAVLTAGVKWGEIPSNPVRDIEKPSATRKRTPLAFPPIVVERIRQEVIKRGTKDPTGHRALTDACLISVMSYAGLRPQEALALTFRDIGNRTISVDKAIRSADSNEGPGRSEKGPTKTEKARAVTLVRPLADDIDGLRSARGNPGARELLFPSPAGDDYWSPSAFGNWRNRVWKPAVKAVEEALEEERKRRRADEKFADTGRRDEERDDLASARPYDCRGSFVSLWLRAGATPLEVAEEAGHSPQVMYSHYSTVIKELKGEPVLSAEEQIKRARAALAEKSVREVEELVVESLKPPRRASPSARALLFGPRAASVRRPST